MASTSSSYNRPGNAIASPPPPTYQSIVNSAMYGSHTMVNVDLDLREDRAHTADPPPGMQGLLKKHQLALLKRCLDLERGGVLYNEGDHGLFEFNSVHGVMGDRVGSGKTLVIIALIASQRYLPPPPERPSVDVYASGTAYGIRKNCKTKTNNASTTSSTPGMHQQWQQEAAISAAATQPNITLVLIPHSLAGQWRQALQMFAPSYVKIGMVRRSQDVEDLRVNTDSPDSERVVGTDDVDGGKDGGIDRRSGLTNLDALVVTSTFYAQVYEMMMTRRISVRRLVIDEADTIRIPKYRAHPLVRFTWYVTASHQNLSSCNVNTRALMPRYNMFPFRVMPYFMARCTDDYVTSSFRLPAERHLFLRCRGHVAMSLLHNNVDARIMESLNAGDVTAAIHQLNPDAVYASEGALVQTQIEADLRAVRSIDDQLAVIDGIIKHALQVGRERVRSHRRRSAADGAGASSSSSAQDENDGDDDVEMDEVLGNSLNAQEQNRRRLLARREEAQRRVDNIRARIVECDACSICYEDICNKTITPCCSNAFCFGCLQTWLASRHVCPLCKRMLGSDSVKMVAPELIMRSSSVDNGDGDGNSSDAIKLRKDEWKRHRTTCSGDKDKCANFEALLRRLVFGEDPPTTATAFLSAEEAAVERALQARSAAARESDEGKARLLVFSSYDGSFGPIKKVLDDLHVPRGHLSGTGAHVEKVVRDFQQGRVRVLMLNAAYFGSGLNLQDATDVVVFHEMPQSLEDQVVGRAQRFGRTSPLAVWHLLHDNEYRARVDSV